MFACCPCASSSVPLVRNKRSEIQDHCWNWPVKSWGKGAYPQLLDSLKRRCELVGRLSQHMCLPAALHYLPVRLCHIPAHAFHRIPVQHQQF